MNATTQSMQGSTTRETTYKWAAGGSAMGALAAIATMALAIVGLAGVLSTTVAAIATIVIGAAILLEGGAFSATSFVAEAESAVSGAGLSAGFLGGLTGIVLGILALLGISQETLLAVALLVFGASFLLSGSPFQSYWMGGASGGHVLVGLGVLVLGILAVIGTVNPLTLTLVGLLALGAGVCLSGSARSTRLITATQ